MAYHIRVANDIHHHHYQSTNGHTCTLNNNMINTWCIEYDYYIFHYYGSWWCLFYIHLSVIFNCYPSCYSYFPRSKNKNIVINITEPTDYLTFSKYIFRSKTIFVGNITNFSCISSIFSLIMEVLVIIINPDVILFWHVPGYFVIAHSFGGICGHD